VPAIYSRRFTQTVQANRGGAATIFFGGFPAYNWMLGRPAKFGTLLLDRIVTDVTKTANY